MGTEWVDKAIAAIEEQQPKVHNTVWCVGEQLKDILRREPEHAESIVEDLKNEGQTLSAVESKIAALAMKNRQGNCGVVSPAEAEKIIRETYGLSDCADRSTKPQERKTGTEGEKKAEILNLEDFL